MAKDLALVLEEGRDALTHAQIRVAEQGNEAGGTLGLRRLAEHVEDRPVLALLDARDVDGRGGEVRRVHGVEDESDRERVELTTDEPRERVTTMELQRDRDDPEGDQGGPEDAH